MKRLLSFLKSDVAKIICALIFFISALILEQRITPHGVLALYIVALLISGAEVFIGAIKGILRRDLLDEKFLMSIASIGAMIVGEWSEGVAVMLFFLVGETFEHHAVRRSRASIRALMDICPDEASVIIDGKEITIDAEDVEVGSIILIRPGERVPIDSVIVEGSADVDTSSMTGEPLPISASEGSSLLSGYIVKNGLIRAKTVREASESAAARVLDLVENANENKSKEESFITKFSHYYTPTVVTIALLVAAVPPILKLNSLANSIYTALTFLVISCPCALVISVPMAFFGGIGGAASRGILFKGGNIFSKIAKPKVVAFDKTGTITSGRFDISEIIPIGISEEKLMYIAASLESVSNHPISECIKQRSNKITTPSNAKEIAGLGITAEIDGEICLVGNTAMMESRSIAIPKKYISDRSIYVSKGSNLIGVISISDEIKVEAAKSINTLKRLGINKTVILSGDREENVKRTAAAVGIDEYYFALKPEDKYNKLEKLISDSNSTVYVGDGINDSPSLARADVGVAMGSLGQDSAIEAADMVIMTDNLMKLPEAVMIARKTISISWQNIIFALGVKGLILLLGLFGYANMWLAVFADVGVAVLAILNSMRALRAPKL